MVFTPATITALSFQSSILTHGLLNFEAIEERITEKLGHLKMTYTIRKFVPVKTLTDYGTSDINSIFNYIKSFPDWFDKDQFVQMYNEVNNKYLAENPDLKNAYDEFISGGGLFSKQGVEKSHHLISTLQEKISSAMNGAREDDIRAFLESDLPLSLFCRYSTFYDAYNLYPKIVNEEIEHLTKVSYYARFKILSHKVKDFRYKLLPLANAIETARMYWTASKLYLLISHSHDLSGLRNVQSLSMKHVDQTEFERLYEGLENGLKNVHRHFLIHKPDVLNKSIIVSQPTTYLQNEIGRLGIR